MLWTSELTVREGYALSFVMVSIVKEIKSMPQGKKLEARTNEELHGERKLVGACHSISMCHAAVCSPLHAAPSPVSPIYSTRPVPSSPRMRLATSLMRALCILFSPPLLLSLSRRADAQNGCPLAPEDIFKAYQFGGQWVYFDATELSSFGQEEGLGMPGLILLGFKDADRLKLHHNVRQARFLEPTEASPGSVQAMAALVEAMTTKRKIALCRMRKSRNQAAKLVALLPQRRTEDDAASGLPGLPCGLHLIELPFADDIRSIRKPPALAISDFSDAQLGAARSLVASLRMPAERKPIVGAVANPALQTHYNYLQLVALNVPGSEVPQICDATKPDGEWLASKAAELDAFREAFDLTDAETAEGLAGGSSSSGKRKASAGGGGALAPKKEKFEAPTSLAEWVSVHLKGQLASLTNPILKGFCSEHKLGVGGKKDDLLARIAEYLEEQMAQEANVAAVAKPAADAN